jgi:hypothetical protein
MRERQPIAEAVKTPMDVLATFGLLYSGLQLVWPPVVWWWAAIAWGAAVGAILCWSAFALSGHRQALRWGTLWGLTAGSFTALPPLELVTVAPVFRIFLLLALRRALRLPTNGRWAVGTLIAGAALGPAGTAVEMLLMIAIGWSLYEFYRERRRRRGARLAAFSASAPAALAFSGGLGVAPFVAGVIIFVAAIFVLIFYSTLASVRSALPQPQGAPRP